MLLDVEAHLEGIAQIWGARAWEELAPDKLIIWKILDGIIYMKFWTAKVQRVDKMIHIKHIVYACTFLIPLDVAQ